MKIHAICVVKNEDDIIEQTLKAAAQWCNFIYVLDNGSTDQTWEKVLQLSYHCPQIIPYKQDNCTFHQGLKAEVFHHYRSHSQPGDWWCRLDADEIYIDDPRIFLAKIPARYQAVWSASFQYYFTDLDLERYEADPTLYADDVPVEQKCRYYLSNWSEARFVRYDPALIWNPDQGWPYFGAVYPVRIWLKHYQNRSPQQMQKRIENRLKARARGYGGFQHEVSSGVDWQTRIKPASQLDYDAHNGHYIVREELMPKLPTGSIQLINRFRNLKRYGSQLKRVLKSLGMHCLCLP